MSQIGDIISASPENMSREELLAHLTALRKPRPEALRDVKVKTTTKKKKEAVADAFFSAAAKDGKTAKESIDDLFGELGV